MNFEQFLLMRQELILTVIAIVLIVAEIAVGSNKKPIINLAIFLFLAHLVIGFFPQKEGVIFGGMYHTNSLTTLIKNILNIGMFIIFLQSVRWISDENNKEKVTEYFVLIISTLIGLDFMISAGDFLMFYLGLELATIPVAALAAYDRYKNKSAEAGIKLIFSSALSSGILLYGLSMIYGTSGSIYFEDIATAFKGDTLAVIGLIFFITGMGFKISLVPFHLWTADVYEGSPINVTSYLSVISKGAAVFVLMTVLYTVFKTAHEIWSQILYVLAILTMTIGNLFALRQNNIKRFLAFSSIAQAGFILLGVLGANNMGMTSVIYFILIYVFTNLGAFGVATVIYNQTGKEDIPDYAGLYRTNPLLSLLMMLSVFSLAGIPPVAGFFGKFFLFTSAASRGYYILVLIAVLNATISLYYYLRVVKAMFIDKSDNPIPYFKSDFYSRLGLIICALGIFFIGFMSFIYEFIGSNSFGI